MTRFTLGLALFVFVSACSESSSTAPDVGRDATVDATSRDASVSDIPPDGRSDAAFDAMPRDGGLDARFMDVTTTDARDSGPNEECNASSCFDYECGRSECGFPCGACGAGSFCAITRFCEEGVPPGEECIDAWNQPVVEGGEGFIECATEGEFQRCMCSGGGRDAWFGCDECRPLIDVVGQGRACRGDDECRGTICDPIYDVCARSCDVVTSCADGNTCAIPGDFAGICLVPCAVCGSEECGNGFECASSPAGNVCVGAGFPSLGRCAR